MASVISPLPIAARYTRSVHIQRDFDDHEALAGYQITPLVMHATERIQVGLQPMAKVRAFSMIGPYGSGKSAFGLFLGHYLKSSSQARRELFTKYGTPELSERLDPKGPRLLPVLVGGNNSGLRRAILITLHTTLVQHVIPSTPVPDFVATLDAALAHPDVVDPQQIADLVEQATQYIAAETPFDGIALIIDELGQYLDYTAREGDERDLFVLQTLAEMAARSGSTPFLILTILHQGFERYASTAGVVQRAEWAKVQGRFSDLVFQEPQTQILRMVGRAMQPVGCDPYATARQHWVNELAPETESHELSLRPTDMSPHDWRSLLAHTYPLHPTVLVALPFLFRQLAQNERSLFAFLSSEEPWSLHDVLRQLTVESGRLPIYRLPHLYSYVEATLGPSLFHHGRGRRWAELAEALVRASNMDQGALDVLTTVGTLGALGQNQLLKASPQHISFALRDVRDADDVNAILERLNTQQHIIYRYHRGSYLLFEGSDLDLDGLLEAAQRDLDQRSSSTALLQEYALLVPFIARRHSYVTGAIRQFDVRFVAASSLPDTQTVPAHADGEVLYVVPANDAELQAMHQWVAQETRHAETQRVVVLPRPAQVQRLRELLLEVGAHERVRVTTPQLENDAPARRELAERQVEAEQALAVALSQTYGPGQSEWWWCGTVVTITNMRDRDKLLSEACDHTFRSTPYIWNELIVRRTLSSAGAKARRNLLEAMLDHGHIEGLGFKGYPPERAIYESVLRESGIHSVGLDGWWHFGPPAPHDPAHLRPVWDALENFIDSATQNPRRLVELYALLEAPPYGVKGGLLPIVFMACYLANAGEIALYEHENFVPIPDIAVFERLIRQPGYFSVRLSRLSGVRITVYERLARALTPAKFTPHTQPAVLDAITPLLRLVKSLPEYTRYTQQLSNHALGIRHALISATSPDTLLFESLPLACGIQVFPANVEPDEQRVDLFFTILRRGLTELQEAYSHLVDTVQEHIRTSFNAGAIDTSTLREELLSRFRQIQSILSDNQLRAVGVRLEKGPSTAAWVESVAALVSRKPMNTWRDADVAAFSVQIADLGRRFRAIEQVAVAVQAVPSTAPVMRIGVTNSQGEQSVIVHTGNSDAQTEILQAELAAVLARYPTMSTQQRLLALVEVLRPMLDHASDEQEAE